MTPFERKLRTHGRATVTGVTPDTAGLLRSELRRITSRLPARQTVHDFWIGDKVYLEVHD